MLSLPPPITGILVKPAGADCNLRCRYCFYLDKKSLYPQSRRRMNSEVLQTLIRQAMGGGAGVVSFCWQGGEPTLMGRPFYEKVVSLQRRFAKHGQTAANSLQTNGLLLDDAFCQFFAENQFLVGISIDGPADLHDHYRKGVKSRPSWSGVREAIERLQRHEVDTNALVMVTDQTVGRVDEIWSTLQELGLRHFQFIPCLELDPRNEGQRAEHSIAPDDYGEILCELFDRWTDSFENGAPGIFVRWFEAVLFGYVGRPTPLCELCPVCGTELVVEHNGDVYSCDFFVDAEHHLGNIARDDLRELLASDRQRSFGARKAQLDAQCRECPWLHRCHGGCLKDRDRDSSDARRSPFCVSYRRFFEHANPKLEELAADWRRRFERPPSSRRLPRNPGIKRGRPAGAPQSSRITNPDTEK